MSGLIIDRQQCTGCGLCVNSCATAALRLKENQAVLDEAACVLCGVCVDACPVGALAITKQQAAAGPPIARGVWVFAEQQQNQVLPVAFELLGQGAQLAQTLGVQLTALLLGGPGIAGEAARLIAGGADKVLLIEDARLAQNLENTYCGQLYALAVAYQPEILLFGATSFGRSLAPRLAARLSTGLTADCTVLDIDATERLLLQTRPAFGGNLLATIITPRHRPQMATVRPGIMPALVPDAARSGEIIRKSYAGAEAELVELLASRSISAASIADAPVIVAAGRGIGSAKNLAYVRELAQLLGGAVGCSRPLVDIGWCEYPHQIGQTGCAVAPKLLICCGISGAIQHAAGIAGAQTIIAINTDAQAPIFQLAHYQVVGDCVEVLKALIAELKS